MHYETLRAVMVGIASFAAIFCTLAIIGGALLRALFWKLLVAVFLLCAILKGVAS
jgi:hypothetical protein